MVEAMGVNGIESMLPSVSSLNGSKVIKVFLYTHLRSLNVPQFGMTEATRLKNMTSRLY
jgi:hypothetical protein